MPKPILRIFIIDSVSGGGTETWLRAIVKLLAVDYDIILHSATLDDSIRDEVSSFHPYRIPRKPAVLRMLTYLMLSSSTKIPEGDKTLVVGAIKFGKADLNVVHFSHKKNFQNNLCKKTRGDFNLSFLNSVLFSLTCIVLEKIVYSSITTRRIATVSMEMKENMEKEYKRPIYLVHNAIEEGELRIAPPTFNVLKPKALFVGGDWRRKGLTDALKAIQLLAKDGMQITLDVYGKGNIKEYSKVAENLQVSNQVIFHGQVPKNKIPYSNFNILISTSSFEVSPMIYLEAMAKGLVVVTYPVYGTKEPRSQNALIITEPSPKAMAGEIYGLLNNPDQMYCYGNYAIAYAKSKTWSSVYSEWREIIGT